MNRMNGFLPQRFPALFNSSIGAADNRQFISLVSLVSVFLVLAIPVMAKDKILPLAAADKMLVRAKTGIMTNPDDALRESESVDRELIDTPASPEKVVMLARSAEVQAAADIQLNRPAEAEAAIARGLHGGIQRIAPKSKLVADLHMKRAASLPLLGDIAGALKELHISYEMYRAINDRRGQALALQNLGINFFYARDYVRALHYFDLSSEIAGNDAPLKFASLSNRGQVFRDQGNPQAAAVEFIKAIELARKTHATLLEARFYGMLADAQLRAGNLDAAEATISHGLSITPEGGSRDWQPELYRVAASLALKRGRSDQARAFIEKALAMQIGASTVLRDAHETAYEIYRASGNEARALQHLEQFKKLDDEARNVAASISAALTANQFDFANQNLKLANQNLQIATLQRGEAKRNATIARNRQQMLLGLLIATGAVILLLLVIQVSLRRSRNRIAAINADLSSSNSDLERALAARTEFLATTSHEIRTPLNGVLGMTQVLLAERGLDKEVRSKIELVHGAGETMRALVDDLLDLAKMTTGEIAIHKAAMNLPALLRETVQVWESRAKAQSLDITLDLQDLPERIVEDEVRLRQIVFNLLSNAIKFTDQGAVHVIARVVPAQPESGERLVIEILDTGIGIPGDRMEEIFESFRQVDSGTTRRHGGTGLGLAICRSLARAMGGTVSVTSVYGAGATFTIDLPLERVGVVEEAPASVSREGGPQALAEAAVLLVEGNLLTQSILRALITPQARAFSTASSIADAEAILASGDVDLLLIDSGVLETRMEAAKDLAARAGRTVLLWPQPDDAVREAAGRLKIDQILSTPLTPAELVGRLRALYGEPMRSEEMAA